MTDNTTKMAILEERQVIMASDINEIKSDLKEIKLLLNSNVVTMKEFNEHQKYTEKEISKLTAAMNKRVLYVLISTTLITLTVAYIFHQIIS